jgi:hypothetical protein
MILTPGEGYEQKDLFGIVCVRTKQCKPKEVKDDEA